MKKLLALILSLSLLWLCACGSQEATPDSVSDSYIPGAFRAEPSEPSDDTDEETEKQPADQQKTSVQTPTLEDRFMATWEYDNSSEAPVTPQSAQQFSNDAGTSIDVLREEIGQTTALFGVAYIGYFEYFEETGIDFGQWFEGASSPLAASYPFVSEIDEAHTIGTEGYLYCILAKDFEASISVATIDGEELYRAENGDPILLFCNRDGDGQTADTVVTITTPLETRYKYEPKLDEMGYPQLLIGRERELLSWDFTPIGSSGFDADGWIAEGWGGVTAVGLAYDEGGTSWGFTSWDYSVSYCLTFYLNENGSYDGEALLQCFYPGNSAVQAEWEGWWSIETEMEQPSRLYLDMQLMRGEDTAAFEDASFISESYLAMVPLSGESLMLIADDVGIALPIFPEDTQAVELTLGVG